MPLCPQAGPSGDLGDERGVVGRAQVSASISQRSQVIAPAPFEYRLVRPDGTVRRSYGESELIKDEDGNPRYVAGIIHDITQLKVAEEALRENEQATRGVLEL